MKKRVVKISWGLVLLSLLASSSAFSLDMTKDPAAKALNLGDLKTAYRVILFDEDGAGIPVVFYQESKLALSNPTLKTRLDRVDQAFEHRLRKEINPLTFSAYLQFASDTNLSESDRIRLIVPMVEGVSRLRPLQKDTLKAFLEKTLTSRISARMKADLLIQSTRSPALGLDGRALLPFFRSTDTTIRRSALKSLIHVIARNRDRGDIDLNRAVFDSIKGNSSHVPDKYEVLALASIGEDFSRDYLLSRCGGDAAKLVAVIRHDPHLRHPGLAYAALAFSKDTPQGIATREALRYGLKDVEWVAMQIASGTFSDSAKADELRRVMAIQTTAAR